MFLCRICNKMFKPQELEFGCCPDCDSKVISEEVLAQIKKRDSNIFYHNLAVKIGVVVICLLILFGIKSCTSFFFKPDTYITDSLGKELAHKENHGTWSETYIYKETDEVYNLVAQAIIKEDNVPETTERIVEMIKTGGMFYIKDKDGDIVKRIDVYTFNDRTLCVGVHRE